MHQCFDCERINQLGHAHPSFRVVPRLGAKCMFYKMPIPSIRKQLPSNLRTFLKLVGKICGMPAIDRGFKTIEYFGLLKLNTEALRRNTTDNWLLKVASSF